MLLKKIGISEEKRPHERRASMWRIILKCILEIKYERLDWINLGQNTH
jgi:hypothetical protein